MTSYLEVAFLLPEGIDRDVLAYQLDQSGASSLEERHEHLVAYFEEHKWKKVAGEFADYDLQVSTIVNQNWNAVWESSFQPVLISDFCYVRAPFHDPLPNQEIIDLILEPKMAFGTAHHETTYMMMAEMQDLTLSEQSVFDFGCGTAILSILAEKLGASNVFAIDIEENAVENAILNAQINSCEQIEVEQKVLQEVPIKQFDVVLANINRAVLLDSAETLAKFVVPGGIVLLSGILLEDEELVLSAYLNAGFKHLSTRSRGEWKCLRLSAPRT